MGLFWDTMRLVQGRYQRALQEHKVEYAEGLHDAIQSFDALKPEKWISVQDKMPTGVYNGVPVWVWDGMKVSIDNYVQKRSNYGHVIQDTGAIVPTTGWWYHYVVDRKRPKVSYWMPMNVPEKPEEV